MKKVIIWDFDGVIVNSESLRIKSFEHALSQFEEEDVNKLIEYHKNNGGLSRFNKIKYFFNNILGSGIDNDSIQKYANDISHFVRNKIDKDLLDINILNFLEENKNLDMHIVSASMDMELKYICNRLDISKYFLTITGSQNVLSSKTENVQNIINIFDYDKKDVVLIGDSINDFDAANNNDIDFCKYNFDENIKINKKVLELKMKNDKLSLIKKIKLLNK